MARVFIVGNGPSLTSAQLDILHQNECISFGVNRIHLMYDKTAWRPTHYMFMDMSNTTHHIYVPDLTMHTQQGYSCHIRSDVVAKFIEWYVRDNMSTGDWNITDSLSSIDVIEQCGHIDAERYTTQEWHFPGVCKQGGSVSGAIQIAVQKGYGPIYLIGCDGNLIGNAHNHFQSNYVDPDVLTVQNAKLANKTLALAHKIAGEECKRRNIKIYNATVGGSALGGIPECDFYGLF